MKPKVYLETSVVSYLTARLSKNVIEAGHQQTTCQFWDRRNDFALFASELVLTEGIAVISPTRKSKPKFPRTSSVKVYCCRFFVRQKSLSEEKMSKNIVQAVSP
ncbi:hypothetical protein Thiowin_02458 [Thiorhodovibrio winogradskyi]|uniref:PIN domain-containing protein n=1 Tax=Thiorhodovibrio winogradskyi TaxID=77007 RepID=A0ABZ0SAX5_9GAMM|nr:hypothetical protein [Thiorhodovibrio winogradskyi]